MNANEIISIIQTILTLCLGGLTLYFKFSTKAQTKAKQIQEALAKITASAVLYIKEAEEDYKDTTQAGGAKFTQVVNKLYELVPEGLNKIITRDMIEDIVQSTFDEIQEYVKVQLDNAVDKIGDSNGGNK